MQIRQTIQNAQVNGYKALLQLKLNLNEPRWAFVTFTFYHSNKVGFCYIHILPSISFYEAATNRGK